MKILILLFALIFSVSNCNFMNKLTQEKLVELALKMKTAVEGDNNISQNLDFYETLSKKELKGEIITM